MNGIYIHIPFCVKKCIYCDFYSTTNLTLEDTFVSALIKEIRIAGQEKYDGIKTKIDTIYFGGGTPSTISSTNIDKIIAEISNCYDVVSDSEITIEVNPGTISAGKLADYKQIGINRINAGVQSFNEASLNFLNRIHTAVDAVNFIKSARKNGFDNVGIDLIYCLPGQTKEMWLDDLKTAVQYNPEHMSCYILTYEDGTPLYTLYKNEKITPIGDELSSVLFETTIDFLSSNRYHHYEISNFSSSVKTRSKHNYKYWDFISYRGFGPSAHSFEAENDKRFWNISNLDKYVKCLQSNRLPVAEKEVLSLEQKMIEALFLGFRKTAGINISLFNTTFNTDFKKLFKTRIKELTASKIITFTENNHCQLTRKGILLADRIASLFVNELQ